jgi:hypothetical protein
VFREGQRASLDHLRRDLDLRPSFRVRNARHSLAYPGLHIQVHSPAFVLGAFWRFVVTADEDERQNEAEREAA